jgi:hypothetical protein
VRLIEKEVCEHKGTPPKSGDYFCGLTFCAELLANYNILESGAKVVEAQHGDAVCKFPLIARATL